MKILVTGASGLIGRALVPALLEEGHAVRALTRRRENLAHRSRHGAVEVWEGDLDDPESLRQACMGRALIIHCAGYAHRTHSDKDLHERVNYHGTCNLLQAAIESGVQKFIFISSSKAALFTGDQLNSGNGETARYGAAKRRAEQALLEAHERGNIQAVCLRPAAVYGPGMKGNLATWARLMEKGLAPPLPQLDTRIAMVGIEDLCRAIRLAATSDKVWGKTYLITDGIPYNIKEIETRLRAALGKKPAAFHVPRPLFLLAAALDEWLGRLPGFPAGLARSGYNALFVDEFRADEAFSRDTGFQPEQSFFTELERGALPRVKADSSA